jgi:nitrite reductase (NO-forming)
MHRNRSKMVLGVLAISCMGLTAWLLGVATGPASGQVKAPKAAKVTIITVTAGKPSELAFKLSKSSTLPAGPVTFKVKNAGKITHDFKICTKPAVSSTANSCTGKVTKRLAAGESATLTVTLSKKGKYEFLCTVPGHAASGMKGLLGIGVKVTALPPLNVPAGGGNATSVVAPGASGAPCNAPQAGTIDVNEFDFGFTLSATTIPCGTVRFNQRNTGAVEHDFVINGVSGGQGARIQPGQNTFINTTLTPGVYKYVCTVKGHDALGMIGTLTVT